MATIEEEGEKRKEGGMRAVGLESTVRSKVGLTL